jgi:hypothetical protein
MSRLILFVALTLAPAICLSQIGDVLRQDNGALAQQANSSEHTIRGQVVNSVTGQPIPRALVQLGSQHAVLTDHDGQFEFDDVIETYGIPMAAKPGYFADGPETFGPGLLTTEDQPITLKLIPEAILSGTAVDPNGQPLQDLRVQLKMLQIRDGLSHWREIQSTTTNAEGEFRFANLQAGKYSLSTGFQLDGLPDAATSVAFVPIAYPPVSEDESASALTLAPGNHIEVSLSPPVERLYPVTGRVDGPPGRGIGFEAETSGGQQFSPVARFNPNTSEFRLLLPSGSYRLKLHAYLPPQQLIGTRDISIGGAPLNGISISLVPLAAIPIEVEYQPINITDNGSSTALSDRPPFLNISLEEVDPAGPGYVFMAQRSRSLGVGRSPQPDDPLTVQNVEPGRYQLRVNVLSPWYLAAASCGNVDLTRGPLVIAGSIVGCTIRAVLRNDSASLRWSINSNSQENESGPVFVYAIPLGNLNQTVSPIAAQPQRAGSAAQGSFESLTPGRYLVIAFKQRREVPYRDTGAVQQYLSLGKEVTLTPNGKSDVQLDVVAGEP